MANNTVSLYIDDTNIRLMVTRGKRITRLADAPLDVGLNDIDTDEQEKELTEKIKNLFKSNKIHAKKVILGLSGLHCLTRPVVLPELPRAMLNEAVTREAKRVLPVPLEQLYISWQILSVAEGKIQAFMVATPRHIADMIIRVLNQAGCKPYLMDIKPMALARLSMEATALIVDVQAKEFDIIIMVNGIPQPIRTVAFPQEELALSEKLLIVKDDVKRTVQFHNSNSGDNSIQANTTLFVSGELAYEPELYESLANELGFKASLLTSPLKCLKQLDPSHHLVNVGLALKEFTREASSLLPNFNTLPTPYQHKQVSLNRILAIPATAAAIGIIVMLAMTVQNAAADIEEVQNQLNTTKFMLEKKQAEKKVLLQTVTDTEQQITSTEAEYDVYTNALKIMNRTGDLMNTDLDTTVDNIITGFHLKTIAHSGLDINISGKADSEQEVLVYVRKLTATGRFSEITITMIKLEGDFESEENSYVQYTLRCALEEFRN